MRDLTHIYNNIIKSSYNNLLNTILVIFLFIYVIIGFFIQKTNCNENIVIKSILYILPIIKEGEEE